MNADAVFMQIKQKDFKTLSTIMKQFFSLLFISMVLAIRASSVDYVIEGEVQGLDGQIFQVSDYDNDKIIGSGEVKDGKLRITGSYDKQAYVLVENGNTYANCIIDTLAIVDFNTHMPSGGSALNVK